MTRNLKTLGLALLAAFALSAVLASAASAEFTTGDHNTDLTVEGVSETQKFTITNAEGGAEAEFSCNEIGIASGGTGLGTAQESITIEPEYSNDCTAVIGSSTFETRIDTNGCHYLFTTDEENAVHIVCEEGKQLEMTAFILGSFRQCFKIHAQTPTEPFITYHNTTTPAGDMDVLMTVDVTGITYERVGLCKGEVNESNNLDYDGEVTVTGHDAISGLPVDVTKSEE